MCWFPSRRLSQGWFWVLHSPSLLLFDCRGKAYLLTVSATHTVNVMLHVDTWHIPLKEGEPFLLLFCWAEEEAQTSKEHHVTALCACFMCEWVIMLNVLLTTSDGSLQKFRSKSASPKETPVWVHTGHKVELSKHGCYTFPNHFATHFHRSSSFNAPVTLCLI